VAVVPHPLGGIPEREVLLKVEAAVGPVVEALCAAAPGATPGRRA
jgi:hypothetical protein